MLEANSSEGEKVNLEALQVQCCEASKVVIQCQCSPVVGKHLRAETADGTKSTRHGLQFHKRSKSRGSRLCTIDS